MRLPTFTYFLIFLLLTSCNIFNSNANNGCIDIPEKNLPKEGTPTQFCIEGNVEIGLIHNPGGVFVLDDEPTLSFSVFTQDSIPHLNWLPTHLLVETDQGFSEEITLVPFACIIPIEDSPEEFPFNVEWWSCNEININNGEVLTEKQKQEIEKVAEARLSVEYLFASMNGGQYIFNLNHVGRASIQEVIPKIKELPYIQPIDGEDEEQHVSPVNNFPECWLSDVVPPPPCPPWYLVNEYRISLTGEKENHIPVQEGGWVKASYTLPDGTVKSTTYTIPVIEQE